MKNRIFLALSLASAILQGPLLPAVFLEGFLLSSTIHTDKERISKGKLVALFVSGLVFDLIQDRTLTTPLIFGVSAVVLSTLGRAGLKNPLFFAVFAALVNIARAQILWGQIFIVPAVFCGVLTFLYFKYTWQETRLGRII